MASGVQAVLFDLDGTLIDHDGAAEVALVETLLATPGVRRVDDAHLRWRHLEELAMDRYLAGELTFTEQRRLRVTSLAAELGLGTWDDRRADAWFAGYLRRYEAAWRIYPDVRPALHALAERNPDLRLGVLTNGDAGQQREKLRHVGLADELPDVIASSEVGAAKPSAEIFHAGCARLRLAPHEVAYVGDRLRTDAIAATDAGLYGIWLNRGDDPAPTGAPVIRTLGDLPAHLAGLAG
ncbi:HAD family hydrolase [Actinoallomurus iriomotensis]|uniref:Hydrolase n=1 Tax=Actinoallomurus iriomotensis TaxID=478107 RepID=A0A9W6VTE7_9ACTN|nr:HAD family hydrolase [Actinoallomurus iriomotensis]GLY78442.1 hydrolase [Actinoallomurus iriomotensis]